MKKLTEQMHYLVIGNYDNFYHMCIEIYARHNNSRPSEIITVDSGSTDSNIMVSVAEKNR